MIGSTRLRRTLFAVCIVLYGPLPAAFAQLRAEPFLSGLSTPVAFVQDPSDSTRQYIVEQSGSIRLVRNGALEPTNFLDLSGEISTGGERGLLGLALAPDYGTSGRFYVKFTNPQGHTVVARFRRSANPLVADPATRFDLQWPGGQRFVVQPAANHNGGTIVFGPDGYLYIGMGDGGGSNDPNHYAQNPNSLLGKMLRLNVSVPDADVEGYDIPPDNPFLDGSPAAALGEIWAFGFRNPWKFSFDDPARGGSGAMLIADVGQGSWEEVDYQPPGRGARNYGWRNREGAHDNVTSLPLAYQPPIDPIFEYGRSEGQSITGGYVYRGTVLGAAFVGRYVFADFVSGRVWSIALGIDGSTLEATASGLQEHTAALGGTGVTGLVSSFGVDAAGELYLVNYAAGTVLRILAPLPQMSLDAPAAGPVTQPFGVAGWAIDQGSGSGTGIDVVHIWATPTGGGSSVFLGSATYGGARADVGAVFGSRFTNSGFGLTVRGLRPGGYTVVAYGRSTVTGTFSVARAVSLTVFDAPRMTIDVPTTGATRFGAFQIAGWALDLAAASGTGADTVHVWAYPASGAAPTFLGAAAYGLARPDVGAVFGSQFTNSGYSLTAAGLAPDTYTLAVYMGSTISWTFTHSAFSTVVVQSGTAMSVDTPTSGAAVDRPFQIAGWAIDRGAPSGTGVDTVHIWAYPLGGGAPVFVGAASYGAARPDVGAVFGTRFTNSHYSLVNDTLAAGIYDVVVYARSTLTGLFDNARVVRITVNFHIPPGL